MLDSYPTCAISLHTQKEKKNIVVINKLHPFIVKYIQYYTVNSFIFLQVQNNAEKW